MSTFEENRGLKDYYYIVDGTLRMSVPEGTSGSQKREWTVGNKSGVKYEMVHRSITGVLQNVTLFEGETDGKKYRTLQLYFDADSNLRTPVISINTDSRYADDIMKCLPNLSIGDEINVRPFSFTPPDRDTKITGVAITKQDSSGNFTLKVPNAFVKITEEDGVKKYTNLHGFPEPTEDDRDDWKLFFTKQNRWLVKYVRENVIPRFSVEN
ncbi:MAG: hypothetical protein KGN01_08005 [Patescibacteria group bacterium]|nr:hypothetical protein [Patescibacteria group bacterium]